MIVESIAVGASGWIAGLVNALPEESVRLFDLAMAGEREQALELYDWFLPLLRLDTTPDFVQLIKLAQVAVGLGSARVRAPRLPVEGEWLETVQEIIRVQLAKRPGEAESWRGGRKHDSSAVRGSSYQSRLHSYQTGVITI